MSNLDALMKHAGVTDPRDIRAYLIGMSAIADQYKDSTHDLMSMYDMPKEYMPPIYLWEVPWDETFPRLMRELIDLDPVLASGAQWGLDAWNEMIEREKETQP